jgi:hypothetical protein
MYDTRDADGDKALTTLDWLVGEGQSTLDSSKSESNMYHRGRYVDRHIPGRLQLLKEIVETPMDGCLGPMLSFGNVLFMGVSPTDGCLLYTTVDNPDALDWSTVTITGTDPDASITDIITDGSRVFFCVPTGTTKGIWANTIADPYVFAKLGSTPTTEAITHLAYAGGMLLAATPSSVGVVNTWTTTPGIGTGVFTPAMSNQLNVSNGSVDLVGAGTKVYWVVTSGGLSFVYEVSINEETKACTVEQFLEFQSDFVATCAHGYVSTIYVGGYFKSVYSGVGRGAIYSVSTNKQNLAPLIELGDYPEETADPSSTENDNRIFAICEAGRDIYFLTPRAGYRWDIDDAGYSHAFDFPGVGSAVQQLEFNTDSLLSWDGTDETVPVTHPNFHPNGWTLTPVANDKTDWTFSGPAGTAQYSGTGQTWNAELPTTGGKDAALSNSTGTLIRFDTGNLQAGDIDCYIKDGTREARFTIGTSLCYVHQYGPTTHVVTESYQQWVDGYWSWSWPIGWVAGHFETRYRNVVQDTTNFLWSYETPAAGESIKLPSVTFPCAAQKSVTVKLQDSTASIAVDRTSGVDISSTATKSLVGADSVTIIWKAGADINRVIFNPVASIQVASTTFQPSIVRHRGRLFAPYLDGSVSPVVDGYAMTGDSYAAEGWLTQSSTSFHTGSLLKDFRYLSIAHEMLPAGCSISGRWEIDGATYGAGTPISSANETRFLINQRGFTIAPTLIMRSDGVGTPIIRSVNVVWNFVKGRTHVYTLDCTPSAHSGQWNEDPETAIRFLFNVADLRALFDDRFSRTYSGAVEKVEFQPSTASIAEGPCGLVRLEVREEY